MTIARAVVVFGVVPLVWSPTRASAEPLPITWSAPPGCPSLRDVTSWLEAVVPAELRTRLSGVTADVRITRVERIYRAAIVVSHAGWTGEREVEGRRCEEVARSAIVIVSVSLAEAVEVAEPEVPPPPEVIPPEPVLLPETTPAPPPETRIAAPPPPVAPVVAAPGDEARTAVLLDIGAGLVFGFGTDAIAPRVSAGVAVALHEHATLGARLRAIPHARVEHAAASADLALVTIGVVASGRYSPARRVHLAGCVGVDAGALIAAGEGLEDTARGSAPWLSLTLAPAIEIGARVRLRVSAELEARVVRPQLTVNGIGAVYHSPTLGGSLDLGLVILIP